MAKLSAFADEVTEDLRCQVEFLAKEKVGYIEPRFINRKNIMDLNPSELKEARTMIRDCLLYTSPSPRDRTRSRMPSSA